MTSEWKERSNQRRDTRHTKDPSDEISASKQGKKDTKKFCNGKPGKEHKLQCMTKPFGSRLRYFVYACSVCGREVDQWIPSLGNTGIRGRPKPAWVVEEIDPNEE